MKQHWHVQAARLQAQNPHWSWAKVCAELQRRSVEARKARQPAPAKPVEMRLPYADN